MLAIILIFRLLHFGQWSFSARSEMAMLSGQPSNEMTVSCQHPPATQKALTVLMPRARVDATVAGRILLSSWTWLRLRQGRADIDRHQVYGTEALSGRAMRRRGRGRPFSSTATKVNSASVTFMREPRPCRSTHTSTCSVIDVRPSRMV